MREIYLNRLLVVVLATSSLVGCINKKRPIITKEQSIEIIKKETLRAPTKICDDHKICKTLREFEYKCSKDSNRNDCKKFVDSFSKLAHKKDCKRDFDTEPVPSVWICDEDKEEVSHPKLFERSARTLSKLNYLFAREFYASKAFRSTLDGAVAEEHLG